MMEEDEGTEKRIMSDPESSPPLEVAAEDASEAVEADNEDEDDDEEDEAVDSLINSYNESSVFFSSFDSRTGGGGGVVPVQQTPVVVAAVAAVAATAAAVSTPIPATSNSISGGGGASSEASSRRRGASSANRGHYRSASHGGGGAGGGGGGGIPPLLPRPSVLKKPGHRRVFSHGQITYDIGGCGPTGSGSGSETNIMMKGHRRNGSKTEFILPPGHEERERKRASLSRSGSAHYHHKRQASRSDSLGFRGSCGSGPDLSGGPGGEGTNGPTGGRHSRQASRTDSVYTIRTPLNTRDQVFSFNFFNKKKIDDEPEIKQRTVVPDHCIPADVPEHEHPNHPYMKNKVRTTKYTLLSFLPKNLFEQFHRFANLYFLFIVLLNWVPAINAFGKEVSMIPVIFVLGFTAIKDIFEDRRRYHSDKRINNSTCRVYKSSLGRYVRCYWKDLKVGDVIHLSCNEQIPADILLLRSSDEHGICYIDTQNLDGETNLKQRQVPNGFREKQSAFQPQDFHSTIECDMPTTKIYRFHGSILHPWGERVPVGKDNLLLRECILKNTDYVEGIVVYAGHESKVMLNNGGPRHKRSELERKMNLEVIWCVVILVVLCFIGAVGSGVWLDTLAEAYVPFIPVLHKGESNPSFEGFLTFWTFVIILQVIIPMSLYVTIEMCKLLQVHLIHQDRKLYDDLYLKRVECRALNIPEELGQVQYIFCDKTGTLTDNKMVFKRCTIGGKDFSHSSVMSTNVNERAIIPVNHFLSEQLNSMDISLLIEKSSPKVTDPPRNNKLQVYSQKQTKMAQDFFLLLALCNTVIVAKYPHRDRMNASGVICHSNSIVSMSQHQQQLQQQQQQQPKDTVSATPTTTTILDEDLIQEQQQQSKDEPDRQQEGRSPSPPLSMMSTNSTAPLQPASSLSTSSAAGTATLSAAATPTKIRHRLINFLPLSSKPLSPIQSSPEGSPTNSPLTSRPKHLQIPGGNIFGKLTGKARLLHNNSSSLLSRSPTPTPADLRPIYEAESPDELALIDAAFAYNCKLLQRSPSHAIVSLPGEGLIDFEVLHVLPFDSNRKRMSVILRHPITLEKILFCKGADNAIMPHLVADEPEEAEIIEQTQTQINNYAKSGLRVLMMGKRILSDEEYSEWVAEHKIAESSLTRRDRLLSDSYQKIETKLKLLGATGIEDRLQEGVPETISDLREAGIVVWVLTGDKQETAINVAYSCKLFSQEMDILKINARSKDAAETTIKYHLDYIENNHSTGESHRRALVIDGKTLIYILDKRTNLQKPFLKLTTYCSSVLAVRATPLQKAFLVRIVKEQLHMKTLAIGDGANDVSMIQTADIGVGISGQEGMQAVMASDFAISRFKYLERLLLVHGHWNYDRLSRMILYFFYKNAAFIFVCFWYQLFCGWSGQVMIESMYLMLYNLIFTSLPPLAIGVYDQDCPDTILMSQPKLYEQGRLGQVYTSYSFWINMADAMYQSVVIFFIAYGTYLDSDVGIWEFGTVICTSCLFVMSLHLAIETKSWTIIHWLSLILSILAYFAFAILYNGACVICLGIAVPYWVIQHAMGTPQFWFIIIISSVLALIPRVFIRTVRYTVFPSAITRVMLARNQNSSSSKHRDSSIEDSWSPRSSVLRQGNIDCTNGPATEMSVIAEP